MLTPRQQSSLARDRYLGVTANAGSGKTRVLVERYCDILLRREAEVGEVVALTYTEKAASELKRKIADRLSGELAASSDPRLTHRLEVVREQLSSAFIETIHSFCARLLHEYPVEAGVDASFSVIEGLEQHTVLQEALKETFRAILRESAADPWRDRLVEAVRRLGKRRVVGIIRMLVEKHERLERLNGEDGLYRRSDDQILGEWAGRIERFVVSTLTSSTLRAAMRRVGDILDGKSAGEVRSLLQGLDFDGGLPAAARRVFEIFTLLLKKDGGLYRSMVSEAMEASVTAEKTILARARGDVLPFVEMVFRGADARHGELLAFSRTLIEVSRRCLDRYGLKKSERGKLDFEDLQLTMRALLRREEIRDHLASRFKFIMVDEYQDTNQIQYELLRPLLHDLTTGNLFIVGDPKQSIYSFRGADVSVFDDTCRDLDEANSPSAASGQIVLEESFRPLRDLAAFVNLVFRPLMRSETAGEREYGVRYEPIVRARQNPAPGRVELILPDPLESVKGSEPGRVAGAIQELVRSGYPVHDGNEAPHPVRFGDIAILLRSRASLPDLEIALAHAGIPYVVTGGVGYFQTQDILDFASYLRFLLNTGDDVALLGILRSPFFTVSDVELFEAVVRGRRATLWEDLLSRRGVLSPRLAGAVTLLEEDLRVSPRLSAPDVLSRIVARTRYQAKISGTSRGAQAAANLEKLRCMAEAHDLQGFSTLSDFTSRLVRLIEEEEEEGEGNIEAQTDAVQVMTVHGAKGLEFPVVVIPSLQRAFRYDGEPFLDEMLGLGFARVGEDGETEEYPLTAYLRQDSRRKTVAEEKRIFYVACTRARDVLMLSADPARGRSGPSWMTWLFEGLGTAGEVPRGPLAFECATGTLELQEGEYRPGVDRHRLTVVAGNSYAAIPAPAQRPAARAAEAPIVFTGPLAPSRGGEIFSATRIRVYRDCPAHYYFRYILGMPQSGSFAGGEEADELQDAEFPPDLRGRIYHGVMEQIDTLSPSDLRGEIERLLAQEVSLQDPGRAILVDEIHRLVTGVVGSSFWQGVQGGAGARTEFTISAVLGEDFLSGTMDRVYRGVDGNWHVLDFKTDRVESTTIADHAAEYWPQLEFYALLVHRFFGSGPVAGELLFTAMPDRVLRKDFSVEALDEIERGISSDIARIRSRDFAPRTSSCPRCPFASVCPWVPHFK